MYIQRLCKMARTNFRSGYDMLLGRPQANGSCCDPLQCWRRENAVKYCEHMRYKVVGQVNGCTGVVRGKHVVFSAEYKQESNVIETLQMVVVYG